MQTDATFEIQVEEKGLHLINDIVAVHAYMPDQATVRTKENQGAKPEDIATNMAKTRYVHIRNIPAKDLRELRLFTQTLFHPPTREEDPHSGGVKYIRQYKIDVSTFMAEKNPQVVTNQILTVWPEVRDYVLDRETGDPVELVRVPSQGRKPGARVERRPSKRQHQRRKA